MSGVLAIAGGVALGIILAWIALLTLSYVCYTVLYACVWACEHLNGWFHQRKTLVHAVSPTDGSVDCYLVTRDIDVDAGDSR